MDIPKILTDKLKYLDYPYEITDQSLRKICNPATSFFWQQFVDKIKRRDEVDNVRKNVVISSLRDKHFARSMGIFEIKEIKSYEELQRVKLDVAAVEERVDDASIKNTNLKHENNAKFVENEKLKEHIKELGVRIGLLIKRKENIGAEINEITEMVSVAERKILMLQKNNDAEFKEAEVNLAKYIEKIKEFTRNNLSSSAKPNRMCFSTTKKQKKCQDFCTPSYKPSKLEFGTPCFSANSSDVLSNSFMDSQLDESLDFCSKSIFDAKKNSTFLCNEPTVFEASKRVLADPEDREMTRAIVNGANRFGISQMLRNMMDEHLKNARCIKISKLNNGKYHLSFETTKLKYLHIKNELIILKTKKNINRLQNMVTQEYDSILNHLKKIGKENLIPCLELAVKHREIQSKMDFYQDAISNAPKYQNSNELSVLSQQILQTRNSLLTKRLEIFEAIDLADVILRDINDIKFDALLSKQTGFVNCVNWAEKLDNDDNLVELDIFRKFPLWFNRKFLYTDCKDYKFNDNEVLIHNDDPALINLIGRPECLFEFNIRNLIQLKRKLELFKSNLVTRDVYMKRYNSKELQLKESYIKEVSSDFALLINSNDYQTIHGLFQQTKELFSLHLELPFLKYIPKDKLVDGKTYAEYEKICLQYVNFKK